MKSPAKCALGLVPLLLAGCNHLPFHRTAPAQPALAPIIEPIHPINLAVIDLPPTMRLIPGKPLYNMRVHDETVKPLIHHRKLASPQEVATTPEVIPNPEVSAIGELSSGDPGDLMRQTQGSIASIERAVNSINHPLGDSDQKTADQIREFLKQANAALASGDVDGAHNLADKAQVLLNGLLGK